MERTPLMGASDLRGGTIAAGRDHLDLTTGAGEGPETSHDSQPGVVVS
jgi:hypothetical protein